MSQSNDIVLYCGLKEFKRLKSEGIIDRDGKVICFNLENRVPRDKFQDTLGSITVKQGEQNKRNYFTFKDKQGKEVSAWLDYNEYKAMADFKNNHPLRKGIIEIK